MYRPLQWPSLDVSTRGRYPNSNVQGVSTHPASTRSHVPILWTYPPPQTCSPPFPRHTHPLPQGTWDRDAHPSPHKGAFDHACTATPLPPRLWTEFLKDACENITFPQLLLRAVNIFQYYFFPSVLCVRSVVAIYSWNKPIRKSSFTQFCWKICCTILLIFMLLCFYFAGLKHKM